MYMLRSIEKMSLSNTWSMQRSLLLPVSHKLKMKNENMGAIYCQIYCQIYIAIHFTKQVTLDGVQQS